MSNESEATPQGSSPALPPLAAPMGWGARPPPPSSPPPLPPAPPQYGLPAAPPPGEPPHRNRKSRFVAALVVGLIASIGVGIGLHDASSSSSSSPTAGFATQPLDNNNSNGNSDVSSIAAKVTPAIVNVTTTLEGGGEAAGTGQVISSSGLVLTNNHVIAHATSIQVDIGGSGDTHSAKVVGYDVV